MSSSIFAGQVLIFPNISSDFARQCYCKHRDSCNIHDEKLETEEQWIWRQEAAKNETRTENKKGELPNCVLE